VKQFLQGALLSALTLLSVFGFYRLGYSDGENNVVSACSYYQKYALDGTQVLLCSAIITPQELMPAVADTNAKFYSKENKDLHKKDRK